MSTQNVTIIVKRFNLLHGCGFMKNIFEKVSLENLLAILFCGITCIVAAVTGQEEIVFSIGGGLIGFVSGYSRGATSERQEQTQKRTQTKKKK